MENPIKMDDLGVPLFLETPISFFRWKLITNGTSPRWCHAGTTMYKEICLCFCHGLAGPAQRWKNTTRIFENGVLMGVFMFLYSLFMGFNFFFEWFVSCFLCFCSSFLSCPSSFFVKGYQMFIDFRTSMDPHESLCICFPFRIRCDLIYCTISPFLSSWSFNVLGIEQISKLMTLFAFEACPKTFSVSCLVPNFYFSHTSVQLNRNSLKLPRLLNVTPLFTPHQLFLKGFNLTASNPVFVQLHPGRLTWNLKMMVWKMIFLFN